MRWKERQKKVEASVYECIDDIADELGFEVPYYPDVYLVGRNSVTNGLKLSKEEKEDLEESKRKRKNMYLNGAKVILIGYENKYSFAEEGGHFLHCNLSGMVNQGKSLLDTFSTDAIEEMWGFFCSKLIEPDRKNEFGKFTDLLPDEGMREGAETLHSIIHFERQINPEFLIYQQGYGLGQKLFDYYLSEELSKKEIRKLYLRPLNNPSEALFSFLELKYQILK